MTDYSSFKDFIFERFNHEIITKLPYKEVEGLSYYSRIYYEPDETPGCGFRALALSCIQVSIPDDDYVKHPPFSANDGIILLADVIAAFDGMRHVYINFDETYEEYGYINYFNANEWIILFKELRNLEIELCRDPAE
jgi:hypothetical protein